MKSEMGAKIEKLREVKGRASLRGGKEKIDKTHQKGKLTAQERLDLLLDPGSFEELYMLAGLKRGVPGEGIITGFGRVNGRPICVYAQDTTVQGGSMGYLHGRKLYKILERALDLGVPVIGLMDSPGARVTKLDQADTQEIAMFRSDEKHGGGVFYVNTQASGVIPQLSAVLGSCAGIAVYSPALTDFVVMVDKASQMFITGPRIVKSVMFEDVTTEDLGGAQVHCRVSGVADFRVENEEQCIELLKKLLGFLPDNCGEQPPLRKTDDDPCRPNDDLIDAVPTDPYKTYDMHKVITSILDERDFLEVKAEYAPEIIVGFGRFDGRPVGIVANQPLIRAGSMTCDSSVKEARFIRFCDAFNIPILLLVDTPAYLPGKAQEQGGIIRHGSKVLYALCEATVPKISILLRKAYGGGNLGMGVCPGFTTDLVFAWPIAECGVVGTEQSVELYFGEEIAKAENPEEYRRQKVKEYTELYSDPIAVASAGMRFDDIIEPRETRQVLIKSFQFLKSKKVNTRYPKKHGNIPL